MSSYHSKFTYLNKDSKKDLGWIIVHFDPDQGETDSYLTQEQIFTDSYNGSKRILYGTKWTEVARPKITVIKQDGSGFNLSECREAYRWLTGNPNASWLDLYVNDELQYSFLVTVQDVKPQKLDARTVGMNIYFEATSPWAYSPLQTVNYKFEYPLTADSNNVLMSDSQGVILDVNSDGVLYNKQDKQFKVTSAGVAYFDYIHTTEYYSNSKNTVSSNSSVITINNQSDDLYSYVYLNVVFTNKNNSRISINNTTLNEETTISLSSANEIVTLTPNHFITSDVPNKTFGDAFNYVWPRLKPGINKFKVTGTVNGEGEIQFQYRYPIKPGDCAIDIDVVGNDLCCGNGTGDTNNTTSELVPWDNIINTPTTIEGYGIADAYNMVEVDNKIKNTTVDEQELNDMLSSILNK